MRRAALIASIVVLFACDSSTPAPDAESDARVQAKTKAGSDKRAEALTAEAAATGLPAATGMLARVGALPTLDLAEHGGVQDARELNRKALDRHKKRDYEASVEGFFAAVEMDPGHVVARFNLACALALIGEADAAFAILEQLEKAACPQCLGQILVAERDSDWDGLRGDPRLKKITRRVYKELVDTKVAAGEVANWFASWEGETPSTLDPRRAIKLEIRVYAGENEKQKKSKLTGPGRLKRWVKARSREALKGYSNEDQDTVCKGQCCAFESRGGINHHTLYLSEVCFKMEGDKPVYVKSLKFFED